MRKLLILSISSLLAACATKSDMPDPVYLELGKFAAQGQMCFEYGKISPAEFAGAKDVVSYSLGTWNFDQNKFQYIYTQLYKGLSGSDATCRNFQAELISKQTAVHRTKQNNAQAAAELNEMGKALGNVVPKSTYCQRIGSIVNCF